MIGGAGGRRVFALSALLCAAAFFSSCLHLQGGGEFCERKIPKFDAEFDGSPVCVRSFEFEDFPLVFHVARVDLARAEVLFSADLGTVEEFAKKTGADLAFNATPFDKGRNPVGVAFFEGRFFSPPNPRYDAAAFERREGRLAFRVADGQHFDSESALLACGGFWRILKGGEPLRFKAVRDSRIALGCDVSGEVLFVLQAEGEFKAKSAGASFFECAEILRRLGASDAIMLDGGGSASLVVDGRQINSVWRKRRVPVRLGFRIKGE